MNDVLLQAELYRINSYENISALYLLGNMKFSIFPLDSCWRIIPQKKQGSALVITSHGIDSTNCKSTCYLMLYGTMVQCFEGSRDVSN